MGLSSKEAIRAKKDWEGYPDFIEWVDINEVEDEKLRNVLWEIYDAYVILERLRVDLAVGLGGDDD